MRESADDPAVKVLGDNLIYAGEDEDSIGCYTGRCIAFVGGINYSADHLDDYGPEGVRQAVEQKLGRPLEPLEQVPLPQGANRDQAFAVIEYRCGESLAASPPRDYPAPIVDHAERRAEALRRFEAVRRR